MKLAPFTMLCLFAVSTAAAQQSAGGDMGLFLPGSVEWKDGPASLRPGAKFAVLEGDPTKEGAFTMRLSFPDGFEVAPHWHSQIEHVTVLAGILHFGMGDAFDRAKTRPMPAGSFGYWPPGMRHFAWTEGQTVLQLHGRGPWTVTYVNPADDPRKTPGSGAPPQPGALIDDADRQDLLRREKVWNAVQVQIHGDAGRLSFLPLSRRRTWR